MTEIKREEVAEDAKYVALGDEGPEIEVAEVVPRPQNIEEKVASMEARMNQIALSLDSIHSVIKQLRDRANVRKDHAISENIEKTKSDMKIPEGIVLVGVTRGVPYYCEVKNGAFYVGVTKYTTLSAAAQGISGVRRSGWAFWKISGGKHNGKSVKEIFK